VEFLERGATVSAERYVQTFKKLKQSIQRVWPNVNTSQVLLLHSAGPHAGLRSREAIGTLGWTVIPPPPYLPDLSHSDLHLFVPLKKSTLRERCFCRRC